MSETAKSPSDEPHDAAAPLRAGELVAGRYRVLAPLGAGGMGTVYEAEHTWTRRRVALKVLRPELGASERTVSRFLREARACAGLSHRHVVQVLDMGQDEADGALFLAQELLRGRDLRAVLRARGALAPAAVLALGLPLAEALAAVHSLGVLHRDLKPENLFLHRDDDGAPCPKVIDFGVARELAADRATATRTGLGLPVGTPRYMSPEQARGDTELDARTDVWSLAAALYELACGEPPFDAATPTLVLAKLLTERPSPLRARAPGVPEALARPIDAALAVDRAERTASMAAFARALAEAAEALALDEATRARALAALLEDGPLVATALAARERSDEAALRAPSAPAATAASSRTEPELDERPAAPTPAPLAARPARPRARTLGGFSLALALGALAAAFAARSRTAPPRDVPLDAPRAASLAPRGSASAATADGPLPLVATPRAARPPLAPPSTRGPDAAPTAAPSRAPAPRIEQHELGAARASSPRTAPRLPPPRRSAEVTAPPLTAPALAPRAPSAARALWLQPMVPE